MVSIGLVALMTPCAAAQGGAGAPPRVLNIVHAKLKPRASATYAALEAQIVRAYDRAKAKVYWICLQSPKDAKDVLYLNLHASAEAADLMAAVYQDVVKRHPEILQLQERLKEFTGSTSSTLTTRRDEIDRPSSDADFATMHSLRVTMVQVTPGREGDFVKAIRTANPKDGRWLLYEANEASTFYLLTLKRTAINRRDGPPLPRTLRRNKGVYVKADTRIYSVSPLMSHVSQAFVAANPQLWKAAAGLH
jgi:hypothetical protein